MKLVCLHEKAPIEAFLRQSTFLNLYGLGDLDDRLWPHTTWYALEEGGDVRAVALMYSGLSIPVLLAIGDRELPALRELVCQIRPLMPARFYAHLSADLSQVLAADYIVHPYGLHYKMALMNRDRLAGLTSGEAVRLSGMDLGELQAFYEVSYPETAFEASMLEVGPFYGVRTAGQLVSVAGVHIYSPTYRVAALGNVATHPEHRGRGYAKTAVRSFCADMLGQVDHIGLNVKADNVSAIRCYGAMGFNVIGQYEECMLELA
jgi:ribosomal protein S18 acetylase RimI-like enzyme